MTDPDEKITPSQMIAIGICFALQMLDGMDVLVVAYAAPQITSEWGISRQIYGIIFSAGVAGMTVGSFLLAPFGDIIGRRRTILIAITTLAISVFLSAFANTVTQLMVLRFVAGLGVGVAGPNLSTLAAEYSPLKYRNFVVVMIGGGYALGATCTGFLAAWVIPEYGWRTMFMVAGIGTAIMLPLAFAMLPESLEFLLKRQPGDALKRVNLLLRRFGQPLLSRLPEVIIEVRKGLGVSSLLAPSRRVSTLGLWAGFLMVYATVYFLLGFVPQVVADMGLPLNQSIYAGTLYSFGGLVGIILLGVLGTRYSLLKAIVGYELAAAACMIVFALVTSPLVLLLFVIAILGFFSQAALVGMVAAAARLYPTELRATGIGWGMGAGRFGAIIGPYVGGLLMTLDLSRSSSLMFFAIPLVLAAVAALFIRFPEQTPLSSSAETGS